jgi:hypothetical protein
MLWAIVCSLPQGHRSKWYLDHQWYDHTNTVKGVQLEDVASQDKYVLWYESNQ